MKRIITIICILAVIVTCSLLGIFKIKNVNEDMADRLDTVTTFVKQENYEKALDEIHQMDLLWEKQGGNFDMYVKHELVDQVARNLAKLAASVKSENQDEIYLTAAEIRYDLHHIYENELPKLKNIF